jgi:hypothetical protein
MMSGYIRPNKLPGEVDMRTRIAILAVAMSLLMHSVPGLAHHSDVAYGSTSIDLKNATIVKIVWANPHGLLSFDVKDETGAVTRWNTEMGSPSAMFAVGWTKNSIAVGDVVTITVFPARNGTRLGRMARIAYSDGKVLNYRATDRPPANPYPNQ